MTQHTQHRGLRLRGRLRAADARGIDEPLATIRRSDVEEVRITWSTYQGNPYVGVRLWGKDRALVNGGPTRNAGCRFVSPS